MPGGGGYRQEKKSHRIVLSLDVVVGRVAEHVIEVWILHGVSPFLPNRTGQERHTQDGSGDRARNQERMTRIGSDHSPVVRGIVSSLIVAMMSTKGTRVKTALKSSGRSFITAPISSPPALLPVMICGGMSGRRKTANQDFDH